VTSPSGLLEAGGMRKIKCPVCGGEVPKVYVRRGTFPCPTCRQPLRIARASRVVAVPIVVGGWSLALLIPHLMGMQGNTFLLAAILLLAPAGFGVAALMGAVRGYLFLKLERDPGVEDGEILHITPRPDARGGRQQR
jgi:hypothetical protein